MRNFVIDFGVTGADGIVVLMDTPDFVIGLSDGTVGSRSGRNSSVCLVSNRAEGLRTVNSRLL